jgi:hypothetical protein
VLCYAHSQPTGLSYRPVETVTLRDLGHNDQKPVSEGSDFERASSAPAEEGGSNSHFHDRPTTFAGRPDAAGNREPNPQPAPSNSDPELTEKPEASQMHLPSKWRLIVSVFLPFAAGCFLSFLFRTINASISSALGVVSPPV